MSLSATSTDSLGVPGVYARPRPRAGADFRLRTDVAGFVGIAGPRYLGRRRRIDDWKSYVETYLRDRDGRPIDPPAGAELTPAVRAFFANGGGRCYVVNVAERPGALSPDRMMQRLLGLNDPAGETGVERLLKEPEVYTVTVPDLHARHGEETGERFDLPDPARAGFGACAGLRPPLRIAARRRTAGARLFTDADLLWAQRYLMEKLHREDWRHFLLLTPPGETDAAGARAWRRELMRGRGDEGDNAALYWPWIESQDAPGAPVRVNPPLGHMAGIHSKTSIDPGAQSAPANVAVTDAVGTDVPVTDADVASVYAAGVNPIRNAPGTGPVVWGARTLFWRPDRLRGEPLVFVNARRTLSAVMRNVEFLAQRMVFEPNNFLMQMGAHQMVSEYLNGLFATGVLPGETPQEAFFVRVVPDLSTAEKLVMEVGIALAAPAEFVIFRVGRTDSVIEIEGRL